MAADAPVRISSDEIVEWLKATTGKGTDQSVMKLVELNPDIFHTDEVDGVTYIVSTRGGRPLVGRAKDESHSFQERMMTPEPKPERPAAALRPRPRGDSTWSTLERVLTDLDGSESDYAMRRSLEPETSALVSQILDEESVPAIEEEAGAAKTIIVPAAVSTDVSTMG